MRKRRISRVHLFTSSMKQEQAVHPGQRKELHFHYTSKGPDYKTLGCAGAFAERISFTYIPPIPSTIVTDAVMPNIGCKPIASASARQWQGR